MTLTFKNKEDYREFFRKLIAAEILLQPPMNIKVTKNEDGSVVLDIRPYNENKID